MANIIPLDEVASDLLTICEHYVEMDDDLKDMEQQHGKIKSDLKLRITAGHAVIVSDGRAVALVVQERKFTQTYKKEELVRYLGSQQGKFDALLTTAVDMTKLEHALEAGLITEGEVAPFIENPGGVTVIQSLRILPAEGALKEAHRGNRNG